MEIDFRNIVFLIGRLNIIHRICVHRAAVDNGIYYGQLPILETIIEHNRCTQTELAETLQVSAPSVATSVKRMQKAGLLKKVADESDLRCNRISITEKGLEFAQHCRSAFDKVDARMFEGFSAEECKTLYGYLERLIDNVATDEFKNKTMLSLINTITEEKQRQQEGEEIHG